MYLYVQNYICYITVVKYSMLVCAYHTKPLKKKKTFAYDLLPNKYKHIFVYLLYKYNKLADIQYFLILILKTSI